MDQARPGKIRSVIQRLSALKEAEATKLRGFSGPDAEPQHVRKGISLNEEKAIKETTKPRTPSEAERLNDSQPKTPRVGR